jgi:signal transduction histidine kinase
LSVRIFFAVLITGLFFCPLSAAQEENKDADWYEGFFYNKPVKSVEEELRIADDKLQEAIESSDKAAQARALIEHSLIRLTRMSDYDQALSLLIDALELTDSIRFTRERTLIYLGMSHVFEQVGNNVKSLEYLNLAYKLNDVKNAPRTVTLILCELGRVNLAQNNLAEALANYELLMEYGEDYNQPNRQADAFFQKGKLYALSNDYPKALENFKWALELRRKQNDKPGEAEALNSIGDLYVLLKNEDRAIANYVASLEIYQRLKDNDRLAELYNNVGGFYLRKGDFQRAIMNIELGLKAGNQAQNQVQILQSYQHLSDCYKALGDYKKALEYKESHQALQEFIQNEKDERDVMDKQNQYTLKKKESQITSLEVDRAERDREIAVQKKLRNFLFVVVGLGVAIVVLILFGYIQKQRSNKKLELANAEIRRQNEQLQQLNATKDKFFSIISHDLKGPLNSLTSFSGLLINYFDSLSKEEIQALAKDLDKSLKNLFALLENLLEWSRSQTGAIEFKPEAFDLSELVHMNIELLTAQAATKEITLAYTNPQVLTVLAHKNSVTTVIRNLISNAIKFTPKGGTITLSASKSNEEALVSIADTGVGMSKEVIDKLFRIDAKHSTKGTADEKGTGLGLVLCKDFVEKNNGNIGVQSEEGKGSTFYFTLPAAP